jgi:hypothetical protein
MLKLLKTLRDDDHGVILSTEIVIVGSLLVIGLISGLSCLRQSVNSELQDVANAIGALDQSYSFSSHRKDGGWGGQCCAWTAGSSYTNCEVSAQDVCEIAGCHDLLTATDDCCHDVAVPLHSSSCSDCGQTSTCGTCSQCGGAAPCGSCSSGYSTGGYGTGAIDIETGVPGVRVSEWPGASHDLIVPSDGCDDCQRESAPARIHQDLFRFPDHVWE